MDSNHRSLTTTDLQSVPFGHSGTPPRYTKTLTRSCRNRKKERDLHRPPESDDPGNSEFFSTHSKIWSWRWESNPQPADYKSAALPVELRQQQVWELTPKHSFWQEEFFFFWRSRKQQMTCTQEPKFCKAFSHLFFKKFYPAIPFRRRFLSDIKTTFFKATAQNRYMKLILPPNPSRSPELPANARSNDSGREAGSMFTPSS